jgi:hypothetical protein
MEDLIMKNKLDSIIITIAMLMVSVSVANAQEKKQEIPAAIRNAQQWIGKWSGTMTMAMQGKTFKPKAEWVFRSVAGGYGVYLEQTSTDPELGTMNSSDLMGFDPFDQKIHVYTVDNMGTCHDHICEWKSADHFYLEHNSIRNGKTYTEKIDMVMKGKDSFDTDYKGILDGKVTESGQGIMKRVK